ncbi:MAG: ATP-grasp domain-containing protein [Dehalococcoidia bacterium]|nr:ATP-grasp domain-containing protein [Dehalococcoidia bacterium]
MILLCGIPTETPLEMVAASLRRLGIPHVWFNQRQFADMDLWFTLSNGHVTGILSMDGRAYRLQDFRGVYIRLMDDRSLPELRSEPGDSQKSRHCHALHDALMQWCEVAPARVVNRAAPMGSNSSKPYQTQLIREHGFAIPETLITNEPELVREFHSYHNQLVYKSISGIRSIVQTLDDESIARLDSIRWCPTQFQEFIPGQNVRVHTIGTSVFATAIASNVTDYRYAHLQKDGETELSAMQLPDELTDRCVRLSMSLGLAFAGIDLKVTPDNRVYCLEVNPSPAFSYYESNTGQPIAEAVARYMAGR